MSAPDERHTLSHVEGKGYDPGVWEVDIELVEDWLKAADDDTYDQIGAAIEVLAEQGSGVGKAAGRLDRRVTTPEHEGTPTGLVRPERGEDLVRLRSQA